MLASNSHDISIMDSSTEIGLMLARDKYGRLQYREKEMQPFSFMQAAGYIDESSQNPSALYPLAFQKSWVGGFGQAFMKSDEPRRYFASYGVDASEDGVLKLGPDWTAINWPETYALANQLTDGHLETWASATDLTNWTETGTVDRNAVTFLDGIYSAYMTQNDQIDQSLAWNVAYRSQTIRACVFYKQTDQWGGTISIYDGIGTTSTSFTSTSNTWSVASVQRTLSASATELTIKVLGGTSASTATYIDCVSVVIPTATNCYVEYAGLQYMSTGNALYKANSATAPTSWTFVASWPEVITALYVAQVSGTAYLFVMVGSGNTVTDKGWYYDGTTFAVMTDGGGTDSSGDYMTLATTTFYIAGRPTGVTTGGKAVLRTNTAPLAGAWSSDISVGATNINITGLVTVNNVVYIAKEDSLWKVNSTGTTDQLIDYSLFYSSTSGKGMTGWNGKVYIPVGVNSLIEYDPDSGTYSNISPAATASSVTQAQLATGGAILSAIQTDFDGRIMAVTGGNEYLWVLQENGAVFNLFKGQYSNIDGAGWHWHPVANTLLGNIYESNPTANATSSAIWGAEWRAQTFTPSAAHSVIGVRVTMSRLGSPGTLTVSLRATDGSGHPTGSDLASGTLDGNSITQRNPTNYSILFTTPYNVSASTKYAFVFRCTGGTLQDYVALRLTLSNPYSGGSDETSTNSGSTWSAQTTDVVFWELGSVTTSATPMQTSILTGTPIIWVASGTSNPGYYDLAKYETSDPTYTYPMFITPYYTGGVWRMMKALYSIILGLESITATVYVTLQYRFYGTTDWSDELTFDGASGTVTNGQDSNFMPADSYGTAIQFRLNFISDANTSTPKVTRITGEGVIKPSEVSVIECVVVLQDHQVTRTGQLDTMPASRKRTGLNTIRASSWPVTFYDIDGTSHNIDLVTREDAAAPERRFTGNSRYSKSLLLKKVTLT